MSLSGQRYGQLVQMSYATGDIDAAVRHAETEPGITGFRNAKLCFCYVDTRRQLGHYTEYLWADPALGGNAVAPWLPG